MQIPVYISATLRTFTDRRPRVELEGATVREVLTCLQDEYPACGKALFEEDGRLRPFVRVFVNDDCLCPEDAEAFDRPLQAQDHIQLLPVIAGGAPVESVIPEERRKQVTLDDTDIQRYNKHLLLRDIGVRGQKRIRAGKVLVVGLGSLGSPVVQYLAAAGVGTLGIADGDEVSLENLQSQVIHGTRDVHRPKTASARDTIRAINPTCRVETIQERLTADNIADVVSAYDIVVDCTDNYQSRYLINDACVLQGKPVVFGAMYQFEGQVSVFDARTGPCFRCQFPSPPPAGLVPTCAQGGVISPLPGVIGSLQANEVLKLLIGGGEGLTGKLLAVDTWNMRTTVLHIYKDENCPVCGRHPSITEVQDFDYEDFCGLKVAEDEIPVETIEAEELVERIERGDPLTIVDVREPHERAIHRFPHVIVIPIGQLARRQKELDPTVDTVFICQEGKRSVLAINTLREAGYKGPMYSLKGGIASTRNIIFTDEGAWL